MKGSFFFNDSLFDPYHIEFRWLLGLEQSCRRGYSGANFWCHPFSKL